MNFLIVKKYVCWLGAALLILSCSNIKQPEYRSVRNFRIDSLGIESSRVKLQAVYFNPNKFGVQLKDTDCEIFIDSTYLGHFTQDSLVYVRPSAEFAIPLTGLVNIQQILKNPLTMFLGKDVLLTVNGHTMAGKAGFYKRYPIKYEGRHFINLGK